MLKDVLDSLKEYRKYLSDTDLKTVSLICFDFQLEEALESFKKQYPKIQIQRICFPEKYTPNFKSFYLNGIKIEKLEDNYKRKNLTVYTGAADSLDINWMKLCEYTNSLNKHFYYYTNTHQTTDNSLQKSPITNFYSLNKKELDYAYSLLSTNADKRVFAQRLKTIIEGKSGYLEYNNDVEYFPQRLKNTLKNGDVVIDAGVSSYCPELFEYSEIVGPEGTVIGFEASKKEYENINKIFDLSKHKNIKLFNLGLWNKNTFMQLSNNQGGSTIYVNVHSDTTESQFVKLDDFIKKQKILKVDYIKMDIEGAEPEALEGAQKTIKTFQPALAICIYHMPDHLFSIINYIDSLCNNYNYHLCHHSAHMYETILYAIPQNGIKKDCLIFKRKFYKKINSYIRKLKNYILSIKNKILVSKFFTKRLLIYANGSIYRELVKNRFFASSNIIALSDISYQEISAIDGYPAIPPTKITEYNPDCIYIAMRYPEIGDKYLKKVLKDKYYKYKIIYHV